MSTITWSNNKMIHDSKQIEFPFEIREIHMSQEIFVVLLSIPFHENFVNNVYGVNSDLQVIWQIQDPRDIYEIKNHMPYEHFYVEQDALIVSNFYGISYKVNPQTGKIIRRLNHRTASRSKAATDE